MAQIIYKTGFEGQNRIECIEGIEINLFNGQKALICPKYARKELLEGEALDQWGAPEETEIEALMLEDPSYKTDQLFALASPAAMWASQFFSDKHNTLFTLPSLLAAMEIHRQQKDIDLLAETIGGADLLRDFSSSIWSCSRFNEYQAWAVNDRFGYVSYYRTFNPYLAIPVILYR